MISDAMRSTHAPKACITDEVRITHEVRITFRKERITQKSPFCPVDKRDFFVGAGYGNRTRLHGLGSRCITDIRTLHFVCGYYSRGFQKKQGYFVVLFQVSNRRRTTQRRCALSVFFTGCRKADTNSSLQKGRFRRPPCKWLPYPR